MKTHFYITYPGNKRKEMAGLYPYLDFTNISTIVEPYAGSCAISFYISQQKSGLTYILNDNNPYLKEMYEILIDEDKTKKFENEFNDVIKDITTKEQYNEITKQNSLIGWLVGHKYYNIRSGICPFGYKGKEDILKPIKFDSYPIVQFFRNNKIIYMYEDAIKVYEQYKTNKKCMIILDPPYISTCNDFYYDHNMNIYEYLYHNNITNENAKIYLILENIWIIKLLFQNNFILFEYDKTYEASKKKTTHIVISNTNKKV
jgi:hypothetical protein